MVCQPQYLLFCDSNLSIPVSSDGNCEPLVGLGQWHFVLERIDGSERLEAMDAEPQIHRDRIALLAVVRGLEALEHPSHVRLMTTSRYVDRGMRFGLPNWRDANYLWESFGALKPIRNSDLWQRISTAMQYHEISCRLLTAGSELAESMIVRHKKRLGTQRQDTNWLPQSRPSRLVVPPNEQTVSASMVADFPADGVGELGNFSQSSQRTNWNSTSSGSLQSYDRSAGRRTQPARRQWWELAAHWVERAQYTAAMAR